MKQFAMFFLVAAFAVSSATVAQSDEMKGMDMKNMDMTKDTDAGRKAQPAVHKMTVVVKSLDAAKGRATLAHGPVKSLNWPAMTMVFIVKDKAVLDKLVVGKKVDVEMMQQGADYVVTAVN